MAQWLTLDELCQYLKISRASLYQMAQSGKIPAVKLGRTWRFDQDQVDLWLVSKTPPLSNEEEFPWSDCLKYFLARLKREFGKRFTSLWIYGSWARGEATPDSDVDLLIVLQEIKIFHKDFSTISRLAYQATFGRDRSVVFSTTLTDHPTFLTSMEPLLLNVRDHGKKAA